jgi:hypothetical protein
MDPALFRIDWEVLAEVLTTITVLAFFVERALSLIFEHRFFVQRFNEKGIKEPIAFLISLAVVRYWNFDALGILMHADKTSWWGYLFTAAIVAGGSKASIKLFHDVLKTKSKALIKAEAINKP